MEKQPLPFPTLALPRSGSKGIFSAFKIGTPCSSVVFPYSKPPPESSRFFRPESTAPSTIVLLFVGQWAPSPTSATPTEYHHQSILIYHHCYLKALSEFFTLRDSDSGNRCSISSSRKYFNASKSLSINTCRRTMQNYRKIISSVAHLMHSAQ
jgi:hypothetical protein